MQRNSGTAKWFQAHIIEQYKGYTMVVESLEANLPVDAPHFLCEAPLLAYVQKRSSLSVFGLWRLNEKK